MTSLTFNVSAPSLDTVGQLDGGQPFMRSGESDVYQPVNATAGAIRQVRRMSDGGLTTLQSDEAVQLVAIESAVIGPAA